MPMGVALRGSFVFDPDENYVRMKSTTMPLDVIWKSCSARYKRLPSFERMGNRSLSSRMETWRKDAETRSRPRGGKSD
jgi:hypothetical protein